MMMMDHAGSSSSKAVLLPDYDPFLSDDFVHDDGGVHMMVAHKLERQSETGCPVECSSEVCWQGSENFIGGRHITGSHCTHNCSMKYNGIRYCGVGVGYQEGDAVDCGGCARPRMCSGLPCWTLSPTLDAPTKSTKFLHRAKLAAESIVNEGFDIVARDPRALEHDAKALK